MDSERSEEISEAGLLNMAIQDVGAKLSEVGQPVWERSTAHATKIAANSTSIICSKSLQPWQLVPPSLVSDLRLAHGWMYQRQRSTDMDTHPHKLQDDSVTKCSDDNPKTTASPMV